MIFRTPNNDDLDNVFECHKLCFSRSEQWYKSFILPALKDSLIVELNNKIIAILLEGPISPCDPNEIKDFMPLTSMGNDLKNNNLCNTFINGITMLCVHPEFRKQGIAKKLIQLHQEKHKDENIICLHTRKTNNAYNLYLQMGYEHIATIKDKYFLPTEDSYFMIKINIKIK